MINEKLLDEAILEHHKKILMQEIRNQVVFGHKDLSQIYGLYLKKTEERRPKNWRFQFSFWLAVVVLTSIILGWTLHALWGAVFP